MTFPPALECLLNNKKLANAYLFFGDNLPAVQAVSETFICRFLGHTKPLTSLADFLIVNAEKSIKIEDIRHIQDQTQYGPLNADVYFVLIPNSHLLTNAAANAFLKTLEEPPEKVCFILLAHTPKQVPETIQSRCQSLYIHSNEIYQASDTLPAFDTFMKFNTIEKLKWAQTISKNKNDVNTLLYMWLSHIVKKKDSTALCQAISTCLESLQYNVNTRLQLEKLILQIDTP